MAEESGDTLVTLDVGGSHISAATYDLPTQTLGPVEHLLIPRDGTTADFLDILEALCRELRPPPAPITGLAAAAPGPFDYQRGISYMKHKFLQLYGVDLRQALAERLGCEACSIHFLNDASAFLLGELNQGAARAVDRAVGITLGTGIGSAFSIGGRTVTSGFGVPAGGEIWNLPYLGGIVENFAGTPAIQRMHLEATGTRVEVHDIAAAADHQPQARQTFERFGTELGKLLRFTTADFAPQRIVIGGGIARSAPLFFPAAQRELVELGIELSVSQLSDRAPLIGAAVSWQART